MEPQKVDVICQNCIDGRVIPLKVRVIDEDGIPQQFLIKEYREIPAFSDKYIQSKAPVKGCTHLKFECKIVVLKRERRIFLTYSRMTMTWMMDV